jgi:hypothetical protein
MIGTDWSYPALAKLVPGVNDLATLYPELAKEADGWDPATVTAGSAKKVTWRCQKGHTFRSQIKNRTPPNQNGCLICAGLQVLLGYNDLASQFPEVAKEADGWDPTLAHARTKKKKNWRCQRGHTWSATVSSRTRQRGASCPYCSGRLAVLGVNDLATLFPDLAKQAYGWDPTKVKPNCARKLAWQCEKGHTWSAFVYTRTPPRRDGCAVCAGHQVLPGVNDLATLFPEVAKQAYGWDPTAVTAGSRKKYQWRCEKGHTWKALVTNRTPPNSTGCPECSVSGFKESLPAWFYLLERPGEQQLGVTNEPEVRLSTHSRNGWQEVQMVGPFPGEQVLATEKKLKKWLRREVGLVPGTHENWFTAKLEVNSLAELKAVSGVETDLF